MTAPATETQVAPYGSWTSPLTTDLITSKFVGLRGNLVLDGEDIYWIESRPTEGGRSVIVRRTPDGAMTDVIPPPFNARTRVHEYGGGAYTVHKGVVYFSNFADQRLYRVAPGEAPEPVTAEGALRYADGVIDDTRGCMVCVREDHTGKGEAVNAIVSINLADGEPPVLASGRVLVSGNDFYSTPRLSPDAARLAWLTWNHPNMPWDGTELWVADVMPDGTLANARQVAGGVDESIFQPTWSPDGVLYFVSDRTGWWNLYRWEDGGTDAHIESVLLMEAEFGLPQWVFRINTYAFASTTQMICSYTKDGLWHLVSLDLATKALRPIATHYTSIQSPQVAPGDEDTSPYVVFIGAASKDAHAVVKRDLKTGEEVVLKQSIDLDVDDGYLATARPVTFPTEQDLTAHGIFYAPKNRDYVGPVDEKPPLLVVIHGGPTGSTSSALNLGLQYWTSRGFAVLDVNYGGSTGYGRAYRERLKGQWGVVDVDDCVNGALYLVREGLVDGERLAIRGGSAGGYTTLSVLTFRDVFKVGASYYGVSDLEALATETHKFESRYLDSLVGPYPERRDLYLARSPIHHTEALSCPIIFLQGLEDKVVPPNQAEKMVAALRDKGIPVAYLAFEGEQHGFRRAENMKRSLEAELYFYARILGFEVADPVEPVDIENL
jgi:dipeptidyl aminopeptidase/acylaminoacyl peptidase